MSLSTQLSRGMLALPMLVMFALLGLSPCKPRRPMRCRWSRSR